VNNPNPNTETVKSQCRLHVYLRWRSVNVYMYVGRSCNDSCVTHSLSVKFTI